MSAPAEQLSLPGLVVGPPEPGRPRRLTLARLGDGASTALGSPGSPRALLPATLPLAGTAPVASAPVVTAAAVVAPSQLGPGCPALPPDEGPALRALEYVVVDTETTGGSALRGHRVTEVAAVRVAYDGTVLEEFTSLVNPERPIPAFISALTNISWEMVRDAPRFADIAPEVARLLEGRVFVAHNAAFDWRFLSWELQRATGFPPEARVLCTVRLARKVVPEVASRSLDALCYFFGLENQARHRAYGDARVTAELLRRLLARVEEREIVTWGALEALVGRRKPRAPRRRPAMPTGMDTSDIPAQ